jgi:2-polyprenyl-6-methoxyphenol hydroxylase-like FAD-dependent oxidoreductase
LMYDVADRHRLAGSNKAAQFLAGFELDCVPGSEHLAGAVPAGPCAVFPMNDSWTHPPMVDGVVLIGDAAGYSDPHLGQGLSVAMRDARVLADLLRGDGEWSLERLRPYAAERAERMRRLRWVNELMTTLRGEFGTKAQARRRRATARMRAEPDLATFRLATVAGPETVPATAFDPSVRDRLLAPG